MGIFCERYPAHRHESDELARFRSEHIGFVFHFISCFPNLQLAKVMMPALRLGKYSVKEIEERAYWNWNRMGMEASRTNNLRSFPGGNSSVWPSPVHSWMTPWSSWQMNPRGNLDSAKSKISSIFSATCQRIMVKQSLPSLMMLILKSDQIVRFTWRMERLLIHKNKGIDLNFAFRKKCLWKSFITCCKYTPVRWQRTPLPSRLQDAW